MSVPLLPHNPKRYSRSLIFSLVIIVAFCIVALLAPWLATQDPYQRGFKNADLPPMWVHNAFSSGSAAHPLGTDQYGRDIYSRYLYGVRTAILLIVCALPITALVGVLVGMTSAYFGRRVDAIIVTLMDIVQSLPGIMFTVILILILRNLFAPTWLAGVITLVISFSAVGWVGLARMVRAETLRLKSQLFFEAAVSLGASDWRILTRHVFPNIAHLLLAWVVNNLPAIILLEAILGYIGVSLTSTIADNEFTVVSWGGLFYAGRSALTRNPAMLFVPALSLLLLSMSFVLLGDYFARKYQR